MFTARKKIRKQVGQAITPLEDDVAKAIFDLETNSNELKADLKELNIAAVHEIETQAKKRALVIFVPYVQIKSFHRIQQRLVRELEKKFSGKHIVIIAQRRLIRKPRRDNKVKQQKRPYSRTVAAVQSAILDDLVYPSEIIGKRTRYRLDGSILYKVQLDRKDQQATEYKLDTFSSVYKKLTGKEIVFEYPVVTQHAE